MSSSNDIETIVAYLPLPGGKSGLGLLSDLRGVVAMARRRYPELALSHVLDVGIKHEGDRVRATLRFGQDHL